MPRPPFLGIDWQPDSTSTCSSCVLLVVWPAGHAPHRAVAVRLHAAHDPRQRRARQFSRRQGLSRAADGFRARRRVCRRSAALSWPVRLRRLSRIRLLDHVGRRHLRDHARRHRTHFSARCVGAIMLARCSTTSSRASPSITASRSALSSSCSRSDCGKASADFIVDMVRARRDAVGEGLGGMNRPFAIERHRGGDRRGERHRRRLLPGAGRAGARSLSSIATRARRSDCRRKSAGDRGRPMSPTRVAHDCAGANDRGRDRAGRRAGQQRRRCCRSPLRPNELPMAAGTTSCASISAAPMSHASPSARDGAAPRAAPSSTSPRSPACARCRCTPMRRPKRRSSP